MNSTVVSTSITFQEVIEGFGRAQYVYLRSGVETACYWTEGPERSGPILYMNSKEDAVKHPEVQAHVVARFTALSAVARPLMNVK